MLTSHRFSSTLGTVTLYLEDEVLIGLDLAGTAGCGGRLMAQLARTVWTPPPSVRRPPRSTGSGGMADPVCSRQPGAVCPASKALRHPVPDCGVGSIGGPWLR